MPVWRYPIVVSAPTTVSPDSCSTRRSTPCVLGCCGPMLTVMVSVRSSAIVEWCPCSCLLTACRRGPTPTACHVARLRRGAAPDAVPLHVCPELFLADFERLVRLRRLAD